MDDGRYVLLDDALISFRYALNFVQGSGLVFNPGERVEGYTNFLWVMLLAGGMGLGVDAIWLAKVGGIACGVAILVLCYLVGEQLVPQAGVWAAFPPLLMAATASLPRYALSGMETLLFSALLCLALWLELALDGPLGTVFASAVLALAALTRPEGVLFYGVFTLSRAVERAWRGEKLAMVLRVVLLSLVAFGTIFVPYSAWRWAYYGYPLPNTFYAKAGGLSTESLGRGLRYLRHELLILNLPMLICGVAGLLVLGRPGVAAMLSTVVAYLAYVLLIGGDDFNVFGPRFLLVVFPWFALIGLAGLAGLARRRQPVRRFAVAIAALALLALEGALSSYEMIPYGDAIALNHGWWTAAEWLSAHAASDDIVAVDAAGIIPYHTGLRAIDMLGLNDVHIAHLSVATLGAGHAGHEKFDPAYVLAQEPTHITTWLAPQAQPLSAGLEQVADRLQQRYELAVVFLMRRPGVDEPTWIDATAVPYTEELHRRGYVYGILRRRGEGGR